MHTSIGRRMRFQALACDFDGTLAMHGIVAAGVIRALKNLSESGRRLILVSGRRLDDLFQVFPDLDIFDYVVVENGAILYKPDTRKVKWLTEPVSKSFISALRARNVSPLEIGGAIVATWHPNEIKVLEAINELGLDLHITFNKGAVMVLPPTVNKATGLAAALSELNLSRHNVVTVGDAENDHVMLQMSECGVAVSNGLPSLKEHSDFVTRGDHGYGVIELIDRILLNDLAECDQTLTRHNVVLGKTSAEQEIKFNPQDCQMLIAGPSQSGKSTIATAILERLAASHYQYCVIDPEGDYESAPRAVILGNRHSAPEIPDILKALENPD
ncbi:MAG TPA: HAD family hydrolase, partial [Chroococcales cyanobacterium]